MQVEDYLQMVAGKVIKARGGNDLAEAARLLRACSSTLLDVAGKTEERLLSGLSNNVAAVSAGDRQKIRRETVYEIESLLDDEGVELWLTGMKGDESVPLHRVSKDMLRKVLEGDSH